MTLYGIRIAVIAAVLFAVSPFAFAKGDTGFLDRSISVEGQTYRYQVYLPADFDKKKSWPVILFLHSVSQRGDDGLQPGDFGIAHAIRADRDRFPFIVVMPQCGKDKKWVVPAMQKMVLAELDNSVHEFHGDRTRIYLTGISMGGFGVWEMAAQYPGRFAAFVPICGGIHGPPKVPDARVTVAADPAIADPYAETARRIGRTPVWFFHGSVDPVVSVEESRQMATALKESHADFRYTEYPGAGHEIWDKAYAEPELFHWLLSQVLVSPNH
ncbi:carboxylesterase family protein [Granulicella mallensis]|uniref:Dienelactone hydrolase n=1 Tax=Granulicella mallensis (strain ATCC BAA-1857 / DSM 23137 / MP5ACTX8) TaxID=682795 RepID=G8NSC2_GRAMM|nr:PHB depolymerase family esterase [Granulicella mallensis]AEU37416.1 dienelactone hydrolase [Granulicella mallensis MP5ACTX8]